MSKYRTFVDYVDDHGKNVIREWLDGLSKAAKAGINALILLLEIVPVLTPPDVKVLKGPDCAGLMELRTNSQRVQYRPLCCYGPGQKEVAILIGAIEKGGRFELRSACALAQAHRRRIEESEHICEHDFG